MSIARACGGAGALLAGVTWACAAPPEDGAGARVDAGGAGALVVSVEPEAPLDAVPRVLRVHVRAPGGAEGLEPDGFVLVRGELGAAHLSQLARGAPSKALRERMVPALAWAVGPSEVVLAPTEALALGEIHTVASGGPKLAVELVVASEDPVPLASLAWPPAGRSPHGEIGIWCGDAPLGVGPVRIALAPDDRGAWLLPGALAGGFADERCVRLELEAAGGAARDEPAAERLVPPLLFDAKGEAAVRLEPIALARGDGLAAAVPLGCGEALRFGPGCARVLDDRVEIAPPAVPVFWSMRVEWHAGSAQWSLASQAGRAFVLGGLPADTEVSFWIGTLDPSGAAASAWAHARTLPPMPHVVLNEVMANPLGPEPEQEWVELYNDGAVAAELEGYVLSDVGGASELPAATLAPGAFALVVEDGFDALSPFDTPAAPGTLLVRVGKLGKNGLSNQGEPLELRDAAGAVVSRFPPKPKPKAGHSVARIAPGAPDGDPASFARTETPTPGAANVLGP
jgi:hypothetical protein